MMLASLFTPRKNGKPHWATNKMGRLMFSLVKPGYSTSKTHN